MNPFAYANDRIFEDPSMGIDAIWRVGGAGAGTAARVIRGGMPDRVTAIGDTHVVSATATFTIRRAQAPAIAEGDTLEVPAGGGVLHRVQGAPISDDDGLNWEVEAPRV